MKNWTHDHWMHLYWIIPQWKWQHSCGYDRMAYPKLGSTWKVSGIACTWGSVRFCGIAYFYYFLTLVFRQLINCLIQTQLNGLWIQTLKECQIKCNKTCKRNDQCTVFSTLQQHESWKLQSERKQKVPTYVCWTNLTIWKQFIIYIPKRKTLFLLLTPCSSGTMVSKERQLHFPCSNGRKGRIVCLELKCLFGAQEY